MPPTNNKPKGVRPFVAHGVLLDWEGKDQAQGDCPLCGKEGRFYVNVENGLWDCKVCGASGNPVLFLRRLYDLCRTDAADLAALATSRRLAPETLAAWGVVRSVLTAEWLVPAYGSDGIITQLYRYVREVGSGRMILLATPELHHGLFGVPLYDPKKGDVFTCEGPWDAMAHWETMRGCKRTDEGRLAATGAESASLLADANVLGVPGANVFQESWAPLFAGKRTYLAYDNDHPRPHPKTGEPMEPVGWAGMRRTTEILAKAAETPREVHVIRWGGTGTHNPDMPNGCDVRDALSLNADGQAERFARLDELLGMFTPIPPEWLGGRSLAARAKGEVGMEMAACSEWAKLINQWRRAMRMTEGLDRALSCMLASIVSVPSIGDQLWLKIMGPAGCGKSTLCEALSINKQYVKAVSTMRGFHSGYKTDQKGDEDHGLIAQLFGKTLVTKDGDTLLTAPNKEQIMAEARDIYDGTARSHYRHGVNRNYDVIRMTWLLCGTASLRALDSSELGERFLDCVIMDGIDDDLEDEVLLRVANRAERNMGIEANGKAESMNDPDMVKAMQMTGGYISYLRANAQRLLNTTEMPDDAKRRCIWLGKFTAYMRARPSRRQDEKAEREFAARLVIQMIRLSKCLAVVLNREEVDAEVMRRVARVALDTARGQTLDIARHLAAAGERGMEVRELHQVTGEAEDKLRSLVSFLRKIGATRVVVPQLNATIKGRPRWALSEKMAALYQKVMNQVMESPR